MSPYTRLPAWAPGDAGKPGRRDRLVLTDDAGRVVAVRWRHGPAPRWRCGACGRLDAATCAHTFSAALFLAEALFGLTVAAQPTAQPTTTGETASPTTHTTHTTHTAAPAARKDSA